MSNQTSITWDDLFQYGSLISVHFNQWSGSVRALPRDLGIDDNEDTLSKVLVSGRWFLVPRDAMKDFGAVKAAAVKIQNAYAHAFPAIRGAHWTTDGNVAQFVTAIQGLQPVFDNALSLFCHHLPTFRQQQYDVLHDTLLKACRGDVGARDRALSRLSALFPSESMVRSKFDFTYSVFTIQGKQGFTNLAGEAAEVKNVISELIERARGEVMTRVQELSAMLTKHEALPPKSFEPTRRLIAKMRSLNFTNDDVLTEQLGVLEAIVAACEANTMTKDQLETSLTLVELSLQTPVEEAVERAEAKIRARRVSLLTELQPVEVQAAPARVVLPVTELVAPAETDLVSEEELDAQDEGGTPHDDLPADLAAASLEVGDAA